MSWPAEWCQPYSAGLTDLASSVEPGARKVRETCLGIANVSGRNPPHCLPSTPAKPRGVASPLRSFVGGAERDDKGVTMRAAGGTRQQNAETGFIRRSYLSGWVERIARVEHDPDLRDCAAIARAISLDDRFHETNHISLDHSLHVIRCLAATSR
jgi:hypothetical protein